MREITYHYSAPLPTIVADISEFYVANGYTITSSSSNTLSIDTLSISTSISLAENTAPSSTSIVTYQTKSTAISTTSSDRPPTDQEMPTSGLNSSMKAGIGVGVTVGVSLATILVYFLIRRLRSQHQRDIVHTGTSTNPEIKPRGSKRYEKPELTGEDARTELDAAAERRRPELAGEEPDRIGLEQN